MSALQAVSSGFDSRFSKMLIEWVKSQKTFWLFGHTSSRAKFSNIIGRFRFHTCNEKGALLSGMLAKFFVNKTSRQPKANAPLGNIAGSVISGLLGVLSLKQQICFWYRQNEPWCSIATLLYSQNITLYLLRQQSIITLFFNKKVFLLASWFSRLEFEKGGIGHISLTDTHANRLTERVWTNTTGIYCSMKSKTYPELFTPIQ